MSHENTTAQSLDAWFLALLACPACEQHHPVEPNADNTALHCRCGRYAYPIRDGIPILLVEEATVLNPNARPEDVS